MKTFQVAVVLSCVAVAALVATSRAAKADFGGDEVVVLKNATSVTIQYQLKWGSGPWRTFSLAPGRKESFEASSVAPAVRFDYVRGDDRVTYKSYRLQQNATYEFRLSTGGRTLDLHEDELILD